MRRIIMDKAYFSKKNWLQDLKPVVQMVYFIILSC